MTLIVNAIPVDGSGGARRPAVRMRADRIAEIGALRAAAGETVVDENGAATANRPGRILRRQRAP